MPDRETTDVLTVLRTLDPADPPGAVDPGSPGARAALERILATDPVGSPAPAPPRRSRRRILAVTAGVVTVATVGVLALPSLTGGDRAFATWTPEAQPLTRAEQASAAEQCRAAQQDGPGPEYGAQLEAAVPVLAESRGAWTTVVLAGADGFSALCVTDGSTRVFDDWFGSIGTPVDGSTPRPGELVATDLGTGSLHAGELSLAAGAAGRDVVAVSYASRSHGTVQGTVSGGRFVLWLPGDDFAAAETAGVELEVTLVDGRTRVQRLRL